MKLHRKRLLPLAAILATVLTGTLSLVAPAAAVPVVAVPAAAAQAEYAPTDTFTATWKRADALKVRIDATKSMYIAR